MTFKPSPEPRMMPRRTKAMLRNIQEHLARQGDRQTGLRNGLSTTVVNGAGGVADGVLEGDMAYWDGTKWVPTSLLRFVPSFGNAFLITTQTSVQKTADEAFMVSDGTGTDFVKVDTTNGILYFNNGTTIYNSDLLLNHATGLARVTVSTSPYTVTSGDVYLGVNTNSARTINLPAANSFSAGSARMIIVKDAVGTGAAVNNITLVRNGADTIDQVAGNKVLNVTRMSLTLLADGGSNWEIW